MTVAELLETTDPDALSNAVESTQSALDLAKEVPLAYATAVVMEQHSTSRYGAYRLLLAAQREGLVDIDAVLQTLRFL